MHNRIPEIEQQIRVLRREGFNYELTGVEVQNYKAAAAGVSPIVVHSPPSEEHKVVEAEVKASNEIILVAINQPRFQQNEFQIQALKYLKGLYLIAKHLSDREVASKINAKALELNNSIKRGITSDVTHHLADEMANCLQDCLKLDSIEKAHTQLTMARDLGVLLEDHPTVCTITEKERVVSKETSRLLKVSPSYYDREFTSLDKQPWLACAKAKASLKGNDTWLDRFFERELELLKEKGVPAPPSARWLPLPPNFLKAETMTGTFSSEFKKDGALLTKSEAIKILADPSVFSDDAVTTQFFRMGTVSPFDIEHFDKAQEEKWGFNRKEFINNRMAIQKYKSLIRAIPSTGEGEYKQFKQQHKGLNDEQYKNLLEKRYKALKQTECKDLNDKQYQQFVDEQYRNFLKQKNNYVEFTEAQYQTMLQNHYETLDRQLKDFTHLNIQESLARKIFKEVVTSQIVSAIEQYKKNYKEYSNETVFFVSYQTLLSGQHFVRHFGIKDNNPRFIRMAKDVMKDEEVKAEVCDVVKSAFPGMTLHFCQTNSAVNVWANKLRGGKDYDEEEAPDRLKKLSEVATLVLKINSQCQLLYQFLTEKPGPANFNKAVFEEELRKLKEGLSHTDLSPHAQNEMMLRARAAVHLQWLMNKAEPYNKISELYQLNFMQASLEFLTLGDQGIKLAGCKSARDRTAIFVAAVKTMQENPEAMSNWETLKMGIVASINTGHHFRTNNHHVPVVKIAEVHEDFLKLFDNDMRAYIKSIKPFSRKLALKSHSLVLSLPEVKEEQEKIAQANLKAFYEYIKEKKDWKISMGGQSFKLFDGQNNSSDVTVPDGVFRMLQKIESAEQKGYEQGNIQTVIQIILINAEKVGKESTGKITPAQLFYEETLKKLGVNASATLSNLEKCIQANTLAFKNQHLLTYIQDAKQIPHQVMTAEQRSEYLEKAAYVALNKIISELSKEKISHLDQIIGNALILKPALKPEPARALAL